MAQTELERPKFLPSFLEALAESARERQLLAIIPYWLLSSFAVGGAAAYLIPGDFWDASHYEGSIVVYVGVLTLNGLILALSWNAFAKIFDLISAPGFCSYLSERKLLNGYITYVGSVQYSQVAAILCSAVALFIRLCDIPVLYNRIALGFMVGLSVYAIKAASAAVTVLYDLIWQKPIFESHMAQQGEKVVRFKPEGS